MTSWPAPYGASSTLWSTQQSATDRQLVVLIHNGGIDLGIPELVDRLIASIPGASTVVSDSMRARLVTLIGEKLRGLTDSLIESADLALNEFGAAKPSLYSEVTVLRDSTATFAEMRTTLFDATRAGRVVDLLILTHGNNGRYIDASGRVGADAIRNLRKEFGGPLNIRSVYMMNCVGSSLNAPWLDAGARTSVGTHDTNYLPEPTTHFFWSKWKEGQTFEAAAMAAYRDTIVAMNTLVRGVIDSFGVPFSLLSSQVDFAEWDFVRDSRPEVVGTGSLTISTDTLPAPVSTTQSLWVTTVLPMSGLGHALSTGRTVSPAGREFVTRWERPLLPPGAEGDAELARRIGAAEEFLHHKIAHPLTQHQIDALVSFACGIGARAFSRSRALALLSDGDTAGVPSEISRWTRVRTPHGTIESAALAERRRAESELFSGATALAVPASREVREYAFQQIGPLAALTAAEAIQVGLAAVAIGQTAASQITYGKLSVSWDSQSRKLLPEATLKMPGTEATMIKHVCDLIRIPSGKAGWANAQLTIEWFGNAYGEMSTPIVRVDKTRTSDWILSDASVSIRAVQGINPRSDPRTWPLCFYYSGEFDPVGTGDFKFDGKFDVNAFGGIRFYDHQVADHSLLGEDWGDDSFHGPDVTVPVPEIPAAQLAYLREHVPG